MYSLYTVQIYLGKQNLPGFEKFKVFLYPKKTSYDFDNITTGHRPVIFGTVASSGICLDQGSSNRQDQAVCGIGVKATRIFIKGSYGEAAHSWVVSA